jgi:hypothetical protein
MLFGLIITTWKHRKLSLMEGVACLTRRIYDTVDSSLARSDLLILYQTDIHLKV